MSRLILLAVIAQSGGDRYYATEEYCTQNADTPANTLFAGRLIDAVYERAVNFPVWGRSGGGAAVSYVDLVNVDGGLDSWLAEDWRDVRITLYVVAQRAAFSAATQVGVCVVDRIEAPDSTRIRFTARDAFARLEKVITQQYSASITNESLRGNARPITLGRVRWLDAVNRTLNEPAGSVRAVYEVADDYFESIEQLLDAGTARTETDSTAVTGTDYFAIQDAQGYGFRYAEQEGRMAADIKGQVRRDSTQMFTNAGFTAGSVGWTTVANGTSTVTFGGSQCALVGNADTASVYQTLTTVAGALYQVTADIDNTTLGGVDFVAGGSPIRTVMDVTTRVCVAYFTAAGTSTVVGMEIPASRTSTATLNGLTCQRVYRVNTLAEVIRFAAVERGNLTTGDIDSAALAAVDTATGYVIGWHSNGGEVRGADLALLAAQSFGVAIYQDGNGKIYPVQIAEPDVTADFELDELSIIEISYEADTAPGLSTRMRYGINYAPHSSEDVSGIAPTSTIAVELIAELKREFSIVTTTETLDAIYAEAEDREPLESLLSEAADAQAEIDRICALYGQPRAFYTVKAFVDAGAVHTIEPGDTVAVTHSRYGLSAGVNLLVVAARSDFLGNRVDLVLWG